MKWGRVRKRGGDDPRAVTLQPRHRVKGQERPEGRQEDEEVGLHTQTDGA